MRIRVFQIPGHNGKAVAGIMQLPEELSGIPPSWGIYITVDDVDNTVKEITSSDGKFSDRLRIFPALGVSVFFRTPEGLY